MDKLVIRGGSPLLGTVRTSGAKNAALPCMAAALLTDEPVILENIPQVRDIEARILAETFYLLELRVTPLPRFAIGKCTTLSRAFEPFKGHAL